MQNKSSHAGYSIIDRCLRDKRKPLPALDYLIDACSGRLNNLGKTSNSGRSTIQHGIKDLREGRLAGCGDGGLKEKLQSPRK